MNDYRELIERLRESVICNKYPIPAMLLDAADTIETMTNQLTASEAAHADLSKRLAAAQQELQMYCNTGLGPEQVMELKSFTQGSIHKVDDGLKHVRDLLQAEQDGRLVVLPCGTDVEIVRDGYAFKADHWSHILTAFRDAPENKSGKQVALFSIEEAEAALAQKGDSEQ